MPNHFCKVCSLILNEYNVVLTECTIQLYLVTQWGYATLKKGN